MRIITGGLGSMLPAAGQILNFRAKYYAFWRSFLLKLMIQTVYKLIKISIQLITFQNKVKIRKKLVGRTAHIHVKMLVCNKTSIKCLDWGGGAARPLLLRPSGF